MQNYQVALIVGSLRRESLNRQLAGAVMRLAPDWISFKAIEIGDLPLYNQDDDAKPAAAVQRLRADVQASQALLFVTPEYNRSIPGVLKNAIDHGSRPSGQSVWASKPAGLLGVSPGAVGTAAAQQHLRNVLSCLDVPLMPAPEAFLQAQPGLFDADGGFGASVKDLMQRWVEHYLAWLKRHAD
ncbi:NADPH-dependent FMN reductase [Roseateles albus]|uniref:NAD(P)H-dependent oxidoreductase n=1 Tax=Roseateles albus TaxID=2987525 RepID=A0ABT5KHR1_9BURK|nr:NADPH-dependent FMN reductase [Roseateles albus]MDC8773406.1 NAD(P)H-dependent oxidoreductase [Roseateles albus]